MEGLDMELEIRDLILIGTIIAGFSASIAIQKLDMSYVKKDVADIKKKVHNGLSETVTQIKTDMEHVKNVVFRERG